MTTLTPAATAEAKTVQKGIAIGEYYSKHNKPTTDIRFKRLGDKCTIDVAKCTSKYVNYEWNNTYTKISQKNYKKYKVTFKSSNPKVVIVNSKGTVIAKAGGMLLLQ